MQNPKCRQLEGTVGKPRGGQSSESCPQNMAENEASLLRKTELENEAFQTKIQQLKSNNTVLRTSKTKTEKEGTRLKLEFEHIRVGFAKEKKEMEVAYQQQVDDMFFYNYRYCMKKHDITNDIPSIPSDDEDETMLGEGVEQGEV